MSADAVGDETSSICITPEAAIRRTEKKKISGRLNWGTQAGVKCIGNCGPKMGKTEG